MVSSYRALEYRAKRKKWAIGVPFHIASERKTSWQNKIINKLIILLRFFSPYMTSDTFCRPYAYLAKKLAAWNDRTDAVTAAEKNSLENNAQTARLLVGHLWEFVNFCRSACSSNKILQSHFLLLFVLVWHIFCLRAF